MYTVAYHYLVKRDDIPALPGVWKQKIRRAIEDRLDQLGNVLACILVVAIRVDNEVGAESQASIQAPAEGARQAQVSLVTHDVVNADLSGYLHGPVGAAVVDDQDFHLIDPGNLPRDIGHGLG